DLPVLLVVGEGVDGVVPLLGRLPPLPQPGFPVHHGLLSCRSVRVPTRARTGWSPGAADRSPTPRRPGGCPAPAAPRRPRGRARRAGTAARGGRTTTPSRRRKPTRP